MQLETPSGQLPPTIRPLVIHSSHDTQGKRDASAVFIPHADAFARTQGAMGVFGIDNRRAPLARAADYVQLLETQSPRVVVQLSHGYQHGTQLTPRAPGHPAYSLNGNPQLWARMVRALARHPDPVVVLFACSTGDDPEDRADSAPGSGDGSYADQLRDALCVAGATWCRVVAHTTAGHAVLNPHVKRFDGMGSPLGGVGAGPLVPASHRRTFARMLALKGSTFAYRMPFMPVGELHSLVAAGEVALRG